MIIQGSGMSTQQNIYSMALYTKTGFLHILAHNVKGLHLRCMIVVTTTNVMGGGGAVALREGEDGWSHGSVKRYVDVKWQLKSKCM